MLYKTNIAQILIQGCRIILQNEINCLMPYVDAAAVAVRCKHERQYTKLRSISVTGLRVCCDANVDGRLSLWWFASRQANIHTH